MGGTARCAAMAVLLGASTVGSAHGAAACGAGELALPDAAGCLRLGGVARTEAAGGGARQSARRIAPAGQGGGRTAARLRAGMHADLDARVPTAAGPLRAYLSVGAGGVGRR